MVNLDDSIKNLLNIAVEVARLCDQPAPDLLIQVVLVGPKPGPLLINSKVQLMQELESIIDNYSYHEACRRLGVAHEGQSEAQTQEQLRIMRQAGYEADKQY